MGPHTCSVTPHSPSAVPQGSSDSTIRLWDTGTGKPKGILRGVTAEQAVMCVDFQSGLVAGGANDSVVRVWDVSTERVRVRLLPPVPQGGG